MLDNGLSPPLTCHNSCFWDIQLDGNISKQLIQDFQRLLGGKAVVQADKRQLIGKSQAVIISPPFVDFRNVFWLQFGDEQEFVMRKSRF